MYGNAQLGGGQGGGSFCSSPQKIIMVVTCDLCPVAKDEEVVEEASKLLSKVNPGFSPMLNAFG